MTALQRRSVPIVVHQHLEDATSLRAVRSVLVRAPHVKLLQLGRTDERLSAHLDGLQEAGTLAAELGRAALEVPGVGQLFVATLLAIEQRDGAQLDRLLSLVEVVPEAARALSSAFGWVSPASLRGITSGLLAAASPQARSLGIAACALHRVDPGAALAAALADEHPALRLRAVRAAGELGRLDLLPQCVTMLGAPDPVLQLAAARAALLLGDRGQAVATVRRLAAEPSPAALHALPLALFTADNDVSRALVRQLAAGGAPVRTMIKAAAWAGDAQVVPWLLKHMQADLHARLAGEAFSFITGVDLAWLDLDRKPPLAAPGGPTDDPKDNDVALDEDDSLPWPDVDKVTAWWLAHGERFQPGTRYFVGEIPSSAHAIAVLKNGFQRQRIAAADYLCLLQPGTALFNVAAPAWRQERLLQAMGV